jgi:SAM-dependent methyltransferase
MLTIGGWLRYSVLRRLLPADGSSVLEIGCGRGALGEILSRSYDYVGIEPDAESFAAARARLGDRVRRVSDDQLPPGQFDLVCAFEVLEHIEDDEGALRRWQARVRPDGRLLVSVPANRRLFGASDLRVGHFRRYDRADLQAVLARAGYTDVEIRSYGFPLGYVLLYASRLLARRTGDSMEDRTASSGRWLQPTPRTAFVRRLVAAPFAVVQRPFERTSIGTGLVARARRPDQQTTGASASD